MKHVRIPRVAGFIGHRLSRRIPGTSGPEPHGTDMRPARASTD